MAKQTIRVVDLEAKLASVNRENVALTGEAAHWHHEAGQREARLAAVEALHSPFALYEECGHDHQEGEPGVVWEVDDVGLTCEKGHTRTVCGHCHMDGGMVREDCWDAEYPCATLKAVRG